jgi:hypothetical protein
MKNLLFSILILLTLVLAACSSTPAASTTNDLPIETQLAVGTLKLSGTEQDVSTKQAEELIVYWQVYEELSQSETSAQAEVDALIAQIQEAMTGEQIQAIAAMEITGADVLASSQGMSVTSSNSSANTVSVPSGSGGMPAGGPPAEGGMPPDGSAMPADMSGSVPASGVDAEASSDSAGVPSSLIDALIQSLQERMAA